MQMSKIRTCFLEVLTRITSTRCIQWTEIVLIFRVADANNACRRKQRTVARVPSRHHAIEHINPAAYPVD